MGPISLLDLAPQTATKDVVVTLTSPNSTPEHKIEFKLDVTYYPNKLTMEPVVFADADAEPDDTAKTSLRNAQSFCDMVAGWNLTGPLVNRAGEEVVHGDETIPLDPYKIRLVPTWVTTQITSAIMDEEFPNRTVSRASRKRS